jgi:hypothetical protein
MRLYKPRNTNCRDLLSINNWTVKVYTITNRKHFESSITLRAAIANLPEWLDKSKALDFETHGTAFLIVHEGTDGVWTLVNWWVDGEILQSLTFHTDFRQPTKFHPFRGEGFVACVWEMDVIVFERAMWIEHILMKAREPDFKAYFEKTLCVAV